MKILYVSNLFGARARGGAERVVAAEAMAMRAAGYEATVVSGAPGPDRDERSVIRHITYDPGNLCFYGDLAAHGAVFRLWWHYFDILNIASATALARIVCEVKPDVVHTHNLMGLGFMIPSMLRRERVRHVHTVHDVQLLDPSGLLPANRDFTPAPHQSLYIAVMRRMMGSPETVIFPSEFHKRLHERFGFFPKSRRVVVRNPTTVMQDAVASAKGGEETLAMFLFAGQLEKHKGIFDLLDAWDAASLSGATLGIAGTGTQALAVAERVASMRGVKMLGRLDGAALDAAYARASWLVLPSRVIENAPASIMEAFAHGVPVLASASGGIPEVVRVGENGMLFPPGDSVALAATLKDAPLWGTDVYARMREAAHGSVTGASAAQHRDELLRIYDRKEGA